MIYKCVCGVYTDPRGRVLEAPDYDLLCLPKSDCEVCQPSDVPCFRCRCGTYLNKYKRVTSVQDGAFQIKSLGIISCDNCRTICL